MKRFFSALPTQFKAATQFLTVFPVKSGSFPDKTTLSGAIAMFPLIGVALGFVLAVSNSVFSMAFPATVSSVLTVLVLVLLTGGLHQDGLADTCDGIFGGSESSKRLEIMRDSRIGTFGVLALIADFLLKVYLITAIPATLKTPALIMMPLASRWGMVLALYLFKYARENGKAKAFFESMDTKTFVIGTAIALASAFVFAKFNGLFIVVAAGVVVYIAGGFFEKKIGGMTGDTLGAMNEICEIVALLLIVTITH
ncbi:MAG: adenosylcobinamide-GDP ribazoletransferase [Elusimicrobiota bacterium]